jgi:hypothetical protein
VIGYGASMFDNWQDFYLLIGSSAGALIGLMFVVTTLTVGRDIRTIERGQRLYTSPVVWHFGAILLLSGAAMAPDVHAWAYGLLAGVIALVGMVASLRIAIGILGSDSRLTAGWFDICWYGVAPMVLYGLLAAVSVAIVMRLPWSAMALAATLMALLLTSIHNAWDLVTWLAPRSTSPDSTEGTPDR